MAVQAVPTKGNLIAFKKSLGLARNGYELLDKKRNILVREMMTLIDRATEIQDKIDVTYSKAYLALQKANITMGFIDDIALSVPEENSLALSYRSVMGVEVPIVTIDKDENLGLYYGLQTTGTAIDEAYACFREVKLLTAELAEVENSVYRLADADGIPADYLHHTPHHAQPREAATCRHGAGAHQQRAASSLENPTVDVAQAVSTIPRTQRHRDLWLAGTSP